MILSFFITSCAGQNENHERVLPSIIHQDSISLRAESLPEFKTDPHTKEYQGNQISGVVRTVFQDSDKNLWFGTQNGLCRHDGQSLIYFDIKNARGKSITVKAISQDNDGNLWVGHTDGVTKYDGTYFTTYSTQNGLLSNDVWSIGTDKNNTVWIGTIDGLCSFNGNDFTAFDLPPGKRDSTVGVSSEKIVHAIMEDSKGNMWFSTNGGAYIFDGELLTNVSEKNGLTSNFVHQVVESSLGRYWISTSNGLFQYTADSLINISDKIFGKNVGVGSIAIDKNGDVWFNASYKIYCFNGSNTKEYENKQDNYSPLTFQIYNDRDNRLWFVGFRGAYRLENNTFINVTRNGPW